MVVALDLERARPPIAHVDDPCFLAWPLHHASRPRRPVPRVGSGFRWTRLLLYEQCSLHITLKIPSSVRLGVRPIFRPKLGDSITARGRAFMVKM